ncbi:hypothetical protein QQ054_32395 [Oscillatoria amoena NRMC-F 0135]|nr:hypothetical protein [Oscillatoria amoena NRMC-F 0135]
MTNPIHIRTTAEALDYARQTSRTLFGEDLAPFAVKAFGDVEEMFAGHGSRFQAIDLKFHDLEHTLRAAVAMITVIAGMNRHSPDKPPVTKEYYDLGVAAVLFHDSGYLRPKGKKTGSGATYTSIHVERSCKIIAEYFQDQGLGHREQCVAGNMILCTGLNLDTGIIPFRSEPEKMAGYALGTGDLLGQMADPAYVGKLPHLFEEFAEARAHDPLDEVVPAFRTVEAMISNTPKFYRDYVLRIFDEQLGGVFRHVSEPYPQGVNLYTQAIEENIRQIEG